VAKKYLYRIGYYSHEDSGSAVMTHSRKIPKKEYRNMFVEATLEILLNRRDSVTWLDTAEGDYHDYDKEKFLDDSYTRYEGKEYATIEEYLKERGYQYFTHFSDIYREVAVVMVELYGFELVEYEQDEWVEGWGGICDTDRSFGKDETLLNRIAKKFWKRKKKK
jgi:hypothetical protein